MPVAGVQKEEENYKERLRRGCLRGGGLDSGRLLDGDLLLIVTSTSLPRHPRNPLLDEASDGIGVLLLVLLRQPVVEDGLEGELREGLVDPRQDGAGNLRCGDTHLPVPEATDKVLHGCQPPHELHEEGDEGADVAAVDGYRGYPPLCQRLVPHLRQLAEQGRALLALAPELRIVAAGELGLRLLAPELVLQPRDLRCLLRVFLVKLSKIAPRDVQLALQGCVGVGRGLELLLELAFLGLELLLQLLLPGRGSRRHSLGCHGLLPELLPQLLDLGGVARDEATFLIEALLEAP